VGTVSGAGKTGRICEEPAADGCAGLDAAETGMALIHLDLFSGIGGFALAAQWVGGIETIGFCDVEEYACQTLEKNFPGIPIYRDVRKLHPTELIPRDGRIDFITAGFPCQDLSVAGNQAGIEADRSGLFFQITRLSDEIYAYCGTRPSLVLENVSNILAGDGGSWARAVYGELAVRGYYCEWKVVSASDVGAPHQRKRWWCLAYMANSINFKRSASPRSGSDQQFNNRQKWNEVGGKSYRFSNGFGEKELADSDLPGMEGSKDTGNNGKNRKESSDQYPFRCSEGLRGRTIERGLGGVADGIPDWLDEPGDIPRVTTGQKNRVARLKGLGNAVVPQCAMIPLMRLKEILSD
jgi:DNA (cytosine-5)-methyltransferase 1